LIPHTVPGGEKGQALVLVVVGFGLFMFAAMGLGIDGAQLYAHRQMAQAAADAAAQAAMMSILRGTNSTSTHPFSTAAAFTCTVPPATLDLRTPCVYAQYNGFGTSTDTVIVSFPGTVSGVTLSAASPTPAVAVSVQRVVAAGLIRFAGISTYTVIAKATSGIVGSGSTNCLYVLDPSVKDALTVSGGSTTLSMNCGVALDSTNAEAAKVSGGATVTASSFTVPTAASQVNISGGSTVTPTPTVGSTVVADPFASLPAPAYSGCDYNNYSANSVGNTLVANKIYCGGITINGGSTTAPAGTYIINGGGVTVSGGSSITGSGVMFYLTGTNSSYKSVTISGGSTATLSAQTSGTYLGILFFQDRSIVSNQNAAISGGSTMSLTGSLYFPTTTVDYSGGSSSSGYTAIIADQVVFSGGSTLNYDPTGLKTGLGGAAAVGILQ
jgi:hypothetical protein